MTDIYEEAIEEADQLHEAAKESAKAEVLEKYNNEVRDKIDDILSESSELKEQEDEPELDLGDEAEEVPDDEKMDDQTPKAFMDGEPLCPCPDDEEEIEIDFDELADDLEGGEVPEESHEEAAEDVVGDDEEPVMESLSIEFGPDMSPDWMGQPTEEVKRELDKIFAKGIEEPEVGDQKGLESKSARNRERRSGLMEIETQKLEELLEEFDKLADKTKKYKKDLLETNKKLKRMNTDKAKLFYQKKILESGSLNERQKDSLVEALEDVDSAKEAKTVFETLQSKVEESGVPSGGDTASQNQESLNEAASKGEKAMPSLNEQSQNPREKTQMDSRAERLKDLAGIEESG